MSLRRSQETENLHVGSEVPPAEQCQSVPELHYATIDFGEPKPKNGVQSPTETITYATIKTETNDGDYDVVIVK